MTRVYLHTFGCKANQYDTEVVRQALEAAGAIPVDDPETADAAVVNSCTVTHVAESKMRGLVRRMARVNPRLQTVVMGCAAAIDNGTISALPGVRAVVPGANTEAVLGALGFERRTPDPLQRFQRGTRAWLKIQDGCDEHCTFCATTIARGRNRSRLSTAIVAEAKLLSRVHREIVLTGVHIGSYGADLGRGASLSALAEELVTEVPHVRFRLSSVEATEVDDRLADLLIGSPRHLAPHIHAPLQSGSDRLLKRMGRHWYSSVSYRERLEALAAQMPVLGLGADIIVGFPGESDEDFAATRAMVESLPFTYLHVFPYSERPGAAAQRLDPPVAPAIVQERSAELRDLAGRKGAAHRASRDNTEADVVILKHRRGVYEGMTGDYLSVVLRVDNPVGSRLLATLRYESGQLHAQPMVSA